MSTAIVWLREDLRLRDNPALHAAAKHGGAIVPVYILCDAEEREFPPGARCSLVAAPLICGGCTRPVNLPAPIADLAESRRAALAAYRRPSRACVFARRTLCIRVNSRLLDG